MTKSFLGADDRTLTITDNNQTVYGADGIQTVKIKTGATNIIVDSNIEKIYLDNTVSSYKFQQAGNQLKIFDNTDNLITQMGIRENGTPLTFANGTVSAAIFGDASGAHISVGGVMVNSTIATTLAVTSIDTFQTSLSSGTEFTLSLKEISTPTQEGKTITFMVIPNAVINKATTLSVDLVGQALNSITAITSVDDFYPGSPILFNVGDSAAKQVTVMVKNDGNPEGMEAFKARLIDENGIEKSSVVATVIDGMPILNFSANNSSVNEGGDSVNFTVTSDVNAPSGGIVIPYSLSGSPATSGVDFSVTAASGIITIPAGSKVGILKVQTKPDDHIIKTPETVTVTLGAISNATINNMTATTAINDTSVILESNKFFLSGSTSVNEGSTAVYTISHAATNSAVTVNYTLTNSSEIGKVNSNDYSGVASSGTLTFAVGETSKTLSIPIAADLTTEGNEALTVTLSSPLPVTETIAVGQNSITTTVFDASKNGASNSFALTTAVESITGTTSDDVISAYIDANGTTDTLNAGDNINGGVGNDTLLITVNGADAGALPAATIASIETISIRETGGVAGNYNLASISGLTTVINNVSSDDITFTGASGAKLIVQGNVVSTNANTTFDNATELTFKDGVNGGNVTRTTSAGGVFTINSVGAENVLDTLDLDSATALTGLTINASTNFTATLSADYAAGSNLIVNGAAAKVDLSGSALSAAIINVNAVSFSGGVMVQVNQADKTPDTAFTGGNGNDTFDIGKVKYNTSLKIDGALGVDTLKISDQDTLSATTVGNISNFELLEMVDDNDGLPDNFDISLLKGITTIQIDADSAGDGYVLNNLSASQAMNLVIAGNQTVAPSFNVNNASLIGNIDMLRLTIDADVTSNAVIVAGINAPGIEEINLNAIDDFTVTTLTGLKALATLTVSGRGNVNLITGNLQLNLNSTIDATASTGMITVDASLATTSSATITGISIKGSLSQANFLTGSAQPDILTGGLGADLLNGGASADSLNGGAGADLLNGGEGSDVINGGAGADAINGGAGVDTLNGGSGDDLFVYAATADLFTANALVDSISGGSGTNSVLLGTSGTAFAIAVTDIWTTRANGIDALIGVANSTANTFILEKSAETAGVKLVDLSNNTALTGNIINVSSFTATNTTLFGGAIGASSIVGGAGNDTITGGAGSDTITGGLGSDVINITAGTDTITDFTTSDILNVSLGATAKIVIAATGGTVNVSGVNNAGTIFVDGSAGTPTAPETIIGSASADILTGGAGSDVITGGAGVDTITGGASADKFVFTALADGTDLDTLGTTVTDEIVGFATGDSISLGAAGIVTNFLSVTVAAASLTLLLTAADTALDGTIDYYFGVVGADGYLVTDSDGNGHTDIIKLTAVTTLAAGDIVI